MLLLIYISIDILGGSPYAALIVTYVVDFCFVRLRNHFGMKNLAAKSLVDLRYLSE
jgi:hypothetical protein